MSVSPVSIIIERIKSATPESRIAVFKTRDGKLDAVFESTVLTNEKIVKNDPSWIGSFHSGMDFREITAVLNELP